MSTKFLSINEDNLGEIEGLEDPETPEMGEEGILTPKSPDEMEFDGDTDLEEDSGITEE